MISFLALSKSDFIKQVLPQPSTTRRGFTLIELLVVVSIILIIVVMTAGVLNILTDGDDVRAAARQVQSALEGARDRAIYAGRPVGLRFITRGGTAPEDNRVCTSMIYVESNGAVEGIARMERVDTFDPGLPGTDHIADGATATDPDAARAVVLRDITFSSGESALIPLVSQGLLGRVFNVLIWSDGFDARWYRATALQNFPVGSLTLRGATVDAKANGLLPATCPARIRLLEPLLYPPTSQAGKVDAFSDEPVAAQLPAAVPLEPLNQGRSFRFRVELPITTELPNERVIQLPRGVVVHLDRSSSNPDVFAQLGNRLPPAWRSGAAAAPYPHTYTSNLDIMFSPRGTVVGNAAAVGLVHLYLAERQDADRDHADWNRAPVLAPLTVPEYGPRNPAGTSDNETYERGEKAFVTIFTRTGAISTHRVSADGNDRFKFSEIGEVASK